jgi:hypothetical protein
MIRDLVRRYGFAVVTVGMTVRPVLFGVHLLVILDIVLKGHIPPIDLIIVMIIPAVISPVMDQPLHPPCLPA